jgi:hypothetical protein
MVTAERFAQGMTLSQYVEQMSVNQERFTSALAATAVTPRDAQALEGLGPRLKLLVITEDWCGTSLAHVPFVARLVDGRPDVEMRIFLRDANPDLMNQYLKHGRHRSIPVFVFFDEHMNEVARFIECRPE